MACADPFLQLDDHGLALQLQSGNWTEDSPPDFALAFDDFEAELKKVIVLVEDLKFAHSIAKAVDSDAVVIEESRVEETQSVQDRDFALSLNEDGNLPSQDVANLPEMTGIMSCELQKLRLSATSPVAPLQALPAITLSARKLSLSTCLNSELNAASVESPFILI